jgi:rhodanese-related sulfurtransferase
MENEINVEELNQSFKESPGQIFLIDLMSKEDFASNHIPGAINIPVEELENHISGIPKDKNVVVVCRRGLMKSDLALEKLHKSGFTNAKKLSGGTSGWFGYFPSSIS